MKTVKSIYYVCATNPEGEYSWGTIKYTFKTVKPEDITVAILTAKQDGTLKLEKDLSAATVGTDYIAWTLTQQETLSLKLKAVTFMCNWKKQDGTRGASREMQVMIADNQKNEVI